jgi:hypothetical protein
MQRAKQFLTIILICLFAVGCQKKIDDTAKDVYELTTTDIAYALGMKCWRVQLPEDLGPADMVSVAFKHPDGSIENRGGASGPWKAGEVIRIIAWDSEDGERLIYTIPEGGVKSSVKKKTEMKGGTQYFSQGKIVNPGDVLMMFTANSSMEGPALRPGDIGLIVHVEKRN